MANLTENDPVMIINSQIFIELIEGKTVLISSEECLIKFAKELDYYTICTLAARYAKKNRPQVYDI